MKRMFLIGGVAFISSVFVAYARVGETKEQIDERYGQPITSNLDRGASGYPEEYFYKKDDLEICVRFNKRMLPKELPGEAKKLEPTSPVKKNTPATADNRSLTQKFKDIHTQPVEKEKEKITPKPVEELASPSESICIEEIYMPPNAFSPELINQLLDANKGDSKWVHSGADEWMTQDRTREANFFLVDYFPHKKERLAIRLTATKKPVTGF